MSVADSIERLAPGPQLEKRIRAHLGAQLGRVLPPEPQRGLDWYYDWVVLGSRAAEALAVMRRYERRADLPWLDIGSGLGSFVLLAALEGHAAIGVEPGEPELVLARARAAALLPGAEPRFLAGAGERLPLADGAVGGVLLHDVLEHVRDWRQVLREARRVLAPGGVLYVKGPSYAVRFVEPHYRVPWIPLLPKPAAYRYLRTLGRDPSYLRHIGYRRRGEVLGELRRLGFALHFPRLDKLHEPWTINRAWMRRLVNAASRRPAVVRAAEHLAESPLQPAIDVAARVPA